jgi:hypothetical protein
MADGELSQFFFDTENLITGLFSYHSAKESSQRPDIPAERFFFEGIVSGRDFVKPFLLAGRTPEIIGVFLHE